MKDVINMEKGKFTQTHNVWGHWGQFPQLSSVERLRPEQSGVLMGLLTPPAFLTGGDWISLYIREAGGKHMFLSAVCLTLIPGANWRCPVPDKACQVGWDGKPSCFFERQCANSYFLRTLKTACSKKNNQNHNGHLWWFLTFMFPNVFLGLKFS